MFDRHEEESQSTGVLLHLPTCSATGCERVSTRGFYTVTVDNEVVDDEIRLCFKHVKACVQGKEEGGKEENG